MADAKICRSLSLSCGRNHEICGFGRLRMPSVDAQPNLDERERHVVLKRHPCRLNPKSRVQALAPLFYTCIFPLFFFFFRLRPVG